MDTFQAIVWIVVGVGSAIFAVQVFWRLRSRLRLWTAEEQPMHSLTAALWRQPEDVAQLDLAGGRGGPDGAPLPPFTFVEEHVTGSRPCVSVCDGRGRKWRVKWGDEVHTETLATRLAWAAGYFVETTHYVREGRVEGADTLARASQFVDDEGRFRDARFELDEDGVIKHFDEHSWSWIDNPFVGSRELNGLKVVMMWLSNWDAKDVRDVALGSNTAIFEYPIGDGLREARYLIIDWGGSLGRWGNVVQRGRWDCEGFSAESETFVQGTDGEFVRFGYRGQRTDDITSGIRVTDVEWLLRWLGQLSDAQIAAAVVASGGSDDEVKCFTRALRHRLEQLKALQPFPPTVASN